MLIKLCYRSFFVFSILSFLLFFFSTSSFAADPANLKRFGIGWGYVQTDFDLFDPVVWDMGVGWYTDWGPSYSPPKIAEKLENRGMTRLTLVLGSNKVGAEGFGGYYSDQKCTLLKNYVLANSKAFKSEQTQWAVGNELGLDPGDLTATKYASEFISWRDCIKGINPQFRVGSGAITSMRHVLPRTFPMSCTNIDSADSGKSYLKTYVNRIRSINGNKMPDFMMMHAYSACSPPITGETSGFSRFKNTVLEYRQAMKELGLQNKELWLKEFNGWGYNSDNFLNDAFEFLINAKDSDLGYPADGNRLVQRFAWFQLKNTPEGMNNTPQVLVSPTGTLTANGINYRKVSRKYAGEPTLPVDDQKKGDANLDGNVDSADYLIWKNNFGGSGNVSKGNFNSDSIIDGVDYSIWFRRYGK